MSNEAIPTEVSTASAMMPTFKQQLRRCLGVLLLIGIGWVFAAMPAQAVATHQWQLTGESADGLAQQYVALDSIRPGEAASQWIVDSYFTEQKANETVRADYVTLYDCDRHRYKDINAEGLPVGEWGDATADPLNLATMDYVCQHLVELAVPQ